MSSSEQLPARGSRRRPTIEEVAAAAERGIILDWSDNPAFYDYDSPRARADAPSEHKPAPRPSRTRGKAAS
jgi:hypothetical protein